ncbi:MAG: arylesterase [Acidobacteria bacterium]|nr:arylesterase [Acidobacteriota bacterium]
MSIGELHANHRRGTCGPALLMSIWCCLLLLSAACGDRRRAEPVSKARQMERAADRRPEAATDDRPVIVALGDSLTAGFGVDPEQNYPARLQRKLDEGGYRYRVVNMGVSGDTSAQGLNRLAAARELRPAVVIVALGANDGLRGLPLDATRDNLEAILRALKEDGCKVVLAGMEIPPNYGPEYTRDFRALFPELARRYRAALIPFLLEGVGGRPELNQEDGIHPTGQGYRIITENVWRILQPLLDRNP